jgi:hypothetical protein
LINTRANSFIFIDPELAKKAAHFLDIPIQKLDNPCQVTGFDGRPADPITDYIEVTLLIDRHKQIKTPILLLLLGSQSMILGRTWAKKYKILINCEKRKLL